MLRESDFVLQIRW